MNIEQSPVKIRVIQKVNLHGKSTQHERELDVRRYVERGKATFQRLTSKLLKKWRLHTGQLLAKITQSFLFQNRPSYHKNYNNSCGNAMALPQKYYTNYGIRPNSKTCVSYHDYKLLSTIQTKNHVIYVTIYRSTNLQKRKIIKRAIR